MKTKLWSLLIAVVISITVRGYASTNETATFQMRLVTDVAAGDCDCDDMAVAQPNGDTTKKELLHVLHKVLADQTDLKSAALQTDQFGHPQIAINFNEKGTKRFAEVTRNSIGKRLAIIIDGRLYSAPSIRSEIPGGKAVISGSFSEDEAKQLVTKLNGAVKK